MESLRARSGVGSQKPEGGSRGSRLVAARCRIPDSGHEETDLLGIGTTCGQYAHYAPVEEDRNPVRQGEQFVHILGDEKRGGAARPLLAQRLVNRFSGADVDA